MLVELQNMPGGSRKGKRVLGAGRKARPLAESFYLEQVYTGKEGIVLSGI